MRRCNYCNRGAYLNDAEVCNGCGAPLPEPQAAIAYDPNVIDGPAFFGRPGVNIPVRTMNQVDAQIHFLMTSATTAVDY